MKSIFVTNHFKFIDRIVLNKRKEMANIINHQLNNIELLDALDIGSTNDKDFESKAFWSMTSAFKLLLSIKTRAFFICTS